MLNSIATILATRSVEGVWQFYVSKMTDWGFPHIAYHAVRLLRSGGVLALDNMLWHDKVADPANRDEQTSILRELGKQIRDDERLLPALLPVGDGLLVAVKR